MSSPTRTVEVSQQQGQRPAGPPIDYSFRDLKNVVDVVSTEPATGNPRHPPISDEDGSHLNDYLDNLVAQGGSTPQSGIYNSTSVRLCNNQLVNLQGLDKALYHILDDPLELVWLDASCNKITNIDDIIVRFPKLQVLYLHGNQIWQLSEVLKLAQLSHLKKLTLHGNPIAEHKHYKMWVGSHLPNLRSLDFSTVTRVDRDKMSVWLAGYQKQQARK